MTSPLRGEPALLRCSTGVPGLDDILGGGLPANQLYLIEGDSGAGKTTLALQFLLEGKRRGERTLWLSLSETRDQLVSTARSHGWDLDGIELYNLSESSFDGGDQYSFFSPGDIELGDVIREVQAVVDRVQPNRIVFDPFSDIRLLARDPLRHRRQVLLLRQFFSGRQCTVLLVQELPRDGRRLDDDPAEGVVQGVITLSQFLPEYGGQRRRLNVHKLRGVSYRDGYHDFTIKTGGLVVYPRLVSAEHKSLGQGETVSSGVAALDELLGGGLDRGTSILALGPAGVGKSTLASQFVRAALARGERAAVFLFDETRRAFHARSDGLGMNLAQAIESGQLFLTQIDPAQFAPGEFAGLVRRSVEKDGVGTVVIDSLSGYLNAMPAEKYLSMHLHELLTYLSSQNTVTIVTLNEHGIVGDAIRPPVDVSYLADVAILLRYFEASGRVHRALSVVKRRTGPHEVTIRELSIAPPGIHVGEPLEAFHGVLTGQPEYRGENEQLTRRQRGDGQREV